MTIYVVVLEDRHIDDQISLYATESKARAAVIRHQNSYGTRYQWGQQAATGWLLYARTDCDDGPTIRIEAKELQ